VATASIRASVFCFDSAIFAFRKACRSLCTSAGVLVGFSRCCDMKRWPSMTRARSVSSNGAASHCDETMLVFSEKCREWSLSSRRERDDMVVQIVMSESGGKAGCQFFIELLNRGKRRSVTTSINRVLRFEMREKRFNNAIVERSQIRNCGDSTNLSFPMIHRTSGVDPR
jgi:hypothetical protein